MLLEFCSFLLNYHQEQIERKRKGAWVRKIFFKEEQNKEFTIIDSIKCLSMMENRISGYLYLYSERFSDSNEEKCMVFKNMAWSLIVHNIIFLPISLSLSLSLSLCIIYFPFYKGKDTSAIPQPSVHRPVYVFPIFCFVFINALITST